MANQEHLDIFAQGADVWNSWRRVNPDISPDLSNTVISYPIDDCPHHTESNLTDVNFFGTSIQGPDRDWPGDTAPSFHRANFSNASFVRADLFRVSMNGANCFNTSFSEATFNSVQMYDCNFRDAYFNEAKLHNVNMEGVNLAGAHLTNAILRNVNLKGAMIDKTRLEMASLVDVDLRGSSITDCRVYGLSSWDVKIDDTTKMSNLDISHARMNSITVDNLELAQFVYLLLNNERIRNVIDTLTSKVVLILGRFTDQRKSVLDALRNELRKRGYTPIIFDFEKPKSRDLAETISTLAHMARFVIADITDAKSIPQELQLIVPNLPSVPVKPILLASEYEYGMFEHFKRYSSVLDTYLYEDSNELLHSLSDEIITPTEAKAKELQNYV